jgi:hypothetical protein
MTTTLIKPNYKTAFSYKAPSYMELAKFIIECKNFKNYQLANIAFICLLRLSINQKVRLIWQSTSPMLTESYKAALVNAHKDLLIVDNGILKVNMPVTLLKEKYMQYVYFNAELHVVTPKDRWCHPPRPDIKILPKQLEYLECKLGKLVPNYKELGKEYLVKS